MPSGTLPLHPILPESWQLLEPGRQERVNGAELRRWAVAAPADGLDGASIAIHGLERTSTDVIVRAQFEDGGSETRLLRPSSTTCTVERGRGPPAAGYLRLGVEHILFGLDHLLFVLALLLIVRRPKPLVATITAFTVAHSITLALATLGAVTVPQAPVEAVIALSIVFVAAELVPVRRGESTLTSRKPWLIAFAFGLIHGLGFAGALHDVGLPRGEIPLALLLFNVGVEIGQLAFVLAALAFIARLERLQWPAVHAWRAVPAYVIGTVAACWMFTRMEAFW
jgi:hydrogenase/urease accessory protein HupE